MNEIIMAAIQSGRFDLTDLTRKIGKYHVEGTLTDAQRDSLIAAAQGIIREQAEILAMHGIETDTGELEQRRSTLLFQDATQGG